MDGLQTTPLPGTPPDPIDYGTIDSSYTGGGGGGGEVSGGPAQTPVEYVPPQPGPEDLGGVTGGPAQTPTPYVEGGGTGTVAPPPTTAPPLPPTTAPAPAPTGASLPGGEASSFTPYTGGEDTSLFPATIGPDLTAAQTGTGPAQPVEDLRRRPAGRFPLRRSSGVPFLGGGGIFGGAAEGELPFSSNGDIGALLASPGFLEFLRGSLKR